MGLAGDPRALLRLELASIDNQDVQPSTFISPTTEYAENEHGIENTPNHVQGHASSPALGSHHSPAIVLSGAEVPSAQKLTSGSEASSGHENPMGKSAVHRLNATGSVQAIVVDGDVLFAGLQGGEIVAWSLETYERLARVHAHQQSVLGLSLSDDKTLLFSCGVDSVINIWSTTTLERLYSLYSDFEVGDIFCVTFSSRLRTLFCGAQNSSIQWHVLEDNSNIGAASSALPNTQKHRFFDSLGPGGVPTPLPQPDELDGTFRPDGGQVMTISQSNYLPYAHKSYIYSMLLAQGLSTHDSEQEILITGGGGGTIKLWLIDNLTDSVPILLEKFKNKNGSVYSLAYKAPFLYAGLGNGVAHIYNLASRQLIRKLEVGCGDILQIQVSDGSALCGTSDGWVKRTSNHFTEVDRYVAHNGKILATAVLTSNGRDMLVTGGNDNTIALWSLADARSPSKKSTARSNDELVNSLRQFVAFRSVAGNQRCVSDCHEAATFLKKQFDALGASTTFISPQDGVNPILLAKFTASEQSSSQKTVLFYGHYDVVDAEYDPAGRTSKWQTEPFSLQPLDGYLYGRGVTDNKGPILAALYAVADLVQNDELSCNVTFLIEGDEEAGSRGFRAAVRQNKKEIGNVDYVMLSNSYWLDDHIPCLTFGMRGVVHASIAISSQRPDLHSGVDGKALQHEPLKDLTVLLASLIGPGGTDIQIPNFYDAVDELTATELRAYSTITSALVIGHPEIEDKKSFTQSLLQKWREPNLTIHQIQVPEAKTAVTIANSAKALLSIRIVPSQSSEQIGHQLGAFLTEQFERMQSSNAIKIKITSRADPWLGKVDSDIYATLRESIIEVWDSDDSESRTFSEIGAVTATQPPKRPRNRRGSSLITAGTFTPTNTPREPLFIREGGSIPAISFLEREFDAPAAMFPMGQASDNAHLDNERIRVENLYNGREVLRRVFSRL